MDQMDQYIKSAWEEWEITGFLGEDSFGNFYRAVKKGSGPEMFSTVKIISVPKSNSDLKTLLDGGMDEQESVTYFENIVKTIVNEIKIMISLNGAPGIVHTYGYKIVGRPQGAGVEIQILMEPLTLFDDWLAGTNMSENEIVKLGTAICSALDVCEKLNPPVIQKDIKLANLFITDSGDFKLGGFGVVQNSENLKHLYPVLDDETPDYMAPEAAKGERCGITAAVYSLGMILYRLTNNNLFPFFESHRQMLNPADYHKAMKKRFGGEAIPSPANASEKMAQIILKACAFEPQKRFQSASAFKTALESLQIIQPIQPKKPIAKKRSPVKIIGIAAAIFLLIILAAIIIIILFDKNKTENIAQNDLNAGNTAAAPENPVLDSASDSDSNSDSDSEKGDLWNRLPINKIEEIAPEDITIEPAATIAKETITEAKTETAAITPEESVLSGYHERIYDNGDKYEGNFVNGVRSGQGRYTWANGIVFEGEFVDGFPGENGTYIYDYDAAPENPPLAANANAQEISPTKSNIPAPTIPIAAPVKQEEKTAAPEITKITEESRQIVNPPDPIDPIDSIDSIEEPAGAAESPVIAELPATLDEIEYRAVSRGNTPGNEVCGSFMAFDAQNIFYPDFSDGGSLYKMEYDGKNKIKLSDHQSITSVRIMGEWIYYDYEKNYGICRMKKDGSEMIKLVGRNALNEPVDYHIIAVVDHFIYYRECRYNNNNKIESDAVKRMDLDGKNQSVILSGEYESVFVDGNQIYYSPKYSGGLYRCDLNGNNKDLIAADIENANNGICSYGSINLIDGWIYYLCYGGYGDGNIYKMRTNGASRTLVDNRTYNAGTMLNADKDGWIYILIRDSNTILAKIRADGTGYKELLRKDQLNVGLDSFCINGDYIYAVAYNHDLNLINLNKYDIYRIQKDGNGISALQFSVSP